jgi:hypothetical protein
MMMKKKKTLMLLLMRKMMMMMHQANEQPPKQRTHPPTIRTANSPAFLALPMATVATGTPPGICTIEYNESTPLNADVFTGTLVIE